MTRIVADANLARVHPTRSPLERIARLSAAFLASNLTRGAIAFALSLVIGRALGVERFGRWVLCTTWASTVTVVADLGFGLLLPRDGARSDKIGGLCGTALAARLTLTLPIAVAIVVAASRLASDPETIAAMRLAALVGVAGAAYGCFGSTFRSQPGWVPTILIVETVWAIAQLVLSWIALHQFSSPSLLGLLAIAAGVQVAQIASALVLWPYAFGDDPVALPPWIEMRQTIGRAMPFAASGIVANLQTRVAPLMLGYLSTQTELGSFAAAAKFGTTARLAPGAIFAGALPVLSREYSDDRSAGARAYSSFHRMMIALAIATAIPCIAFGPLLLRVIYGAPFVAAAPALAAIGIGLVPALTNSTKKIFLYAAGEESFVLAWSAVSLAAQIVTAFVLMPRFGSVGAAVSLALGEAVIWPPLRRRVCQTVRPSSPRRAPASTHARVPPVVPDAADPAAV